MDQLSKIKKENNFKVPENYFEEFSERLQKRIEEESGQDRKGKIISIIRPYIAYAASFAGLILVTMIMYYYLKPDDSVAIALTEEEIYEEMAYYAYDLDENLLIDVLVNDTDYGIEDDDNGEANAIIDYLLDENIDINIIEDAL